MSGKATFEDMVGVMASNKLLIDYFAGQALTGLLVSSGAACVGSGGALMLASLAYKMATVMLEERVALSNDEAKEHP
jgi:TRAP-type mannitol/chloroaromatic compound transport system permease large subunit